MFFFFFFCVAVFKWLSNRLITLYLCANVLFCFSFVRLEKKVLTGDMICVVIFACEGSPLLFKCNTTALYCSASFSAVLTVFCCCNYFKHLQACSSSFRFILFLNSPLWILCTVFSTAVTSHASSVSLCMYSVSYTPIHCFMNPLM